MKRSTYRPHRFRHQARIFALLLLAATLASAGSASAGAPEFEQILHAGTTTAILEHGGLVLRGLDGGGIIIHDIAAGVEVDHWTAGQNISGNLISDMSWTGQNIWIATRGGGLTRVTDLEGATQFREFTGSIGDLDVTAVTGRVIGETERVFYGMDGRGVGQINSGLPGNIYTTDDGLISNDVNALVMLGDELFVGTPAGISRFADNVFTDQNAGLPNLSINDLLVDSDGNLLAASNGGIHQWDPDAGTWSSIGTLGAPVVDLAAGRGQVYALGLAASGGGVLRRFDGVAWTPVDLPYFRCSAIEAGEYLWVSGPEINQTVGGRTTYNYLGQQLADDTFSTWVRVSTQVTYSEGVAFDSQGRAWMGDFSGFQISRYDPADNSYLLLFERPHAGNDTLNLFPGLGPVLSIAGSPDGAVYASQYFGGGVIKYNGGTTRTTDLIDPDNSRLQGRAIVNMVVHPDGSLIVMHDQEDPQNVEVLVDPDNWSEDASWVLPTMDEGLGDGPTVWDALVERRDIIWFAVEGGGLVRWDINGPGAGPGDPLTWTDPSDDVWYDPISFFTDSALNPTDAVALALGRDGSLWVGGNGLVQFDYELSAGTALNTRVIQDMVEKNPAEPDKPGLINGNVKDLATDANGDIWVSTPTGINRVSPRGDEALVSAWTDLGNFLGNPNYGVLYSFNIIAPLPGQTYARLAASPDGKKMLLSSDQGTTLITVGSGPGSGSAGGDPLENIYCYPNPWSPDESTDRLKLGRLPTETVAVSIYNLEGQIIHSDNFVAEDIGFWEGKNIMDRPVSSGMYILKITALGRTTTRVLAVAR